MNVTILIGIKPSSEELEVILHWSIGFSLFPVETKWSIIQANTTINSSNSNVLYN